MDRREAIKTSSLILGYAVTATTAAAVLNGCQADRSIDWTPKYLDKKQALLVGDISELIIPKTDTPGAKEAMVDRFIDAMLGAWKPEDRTLFTTALVDFDTEAEKQFKRGFVKCTKEQQIKVLDVLVEDSKNKDSHIFKTMKELTVVGYCKSELGATTLLTYDPVPGAPYEGCVDFSTVGATYSL
ncbi:MAG: gluconate 2-dehydrogenase subunit 3 family protein [Saprospiraceae bacterium]|nr:gluconate 2-dehydrogenase subunit 3 family protein [Bacteroidia bacterium]NNL93189.1 gluconate 2-dehydrogenase subunit 3 family protein [Saprospiraceae bacterium]